MRLRQTNPTLRLPSSPPCPPGPTRLLLILPVLFLSLLAPQAPAAAQDDSRLQLEHYLDWEFVNNPQLSPDGSQVIYTREWIDKINDRHANQIWIMSADGTRDRYLLDGSQPTWSPDGTRIAFVKDGDPSGSQIFVRWMDAEGAVSQVTRLTESPSSIQWSPDGEWIAFNMLVEEVHGPGLANRHARPSRRCRLDRAAPDRRAPQLPAGRIGMVAGRVPTHLRRVGQRGHR